MKKDMSTKKIIVLAVMVTLSVTGRLIFVFLPFIKPVTAVTVISGIWFGPEIGFLTGSLSALISNFYFGQGPWTPFQMFAWGIIGLFAGLLSNHLRKGKARVALFGLLSGAVFSLVLDVWVVVWADGVFNLYRYLAVLVIGAPATLTYALSNSLFLLVAIKPVGKKLDRIKMKYGL